MEIFVSLGILVTLIFQKGFRFFQYLMNIISKFIFLKETRCCSRGSQRLPQSVLTALRELRVGAIWACIVTEHKGHQE